MRPDSEWAEHLVGVDVVRYCVQDVDAGAAAVRAGAQDVELTGVALSSQVTAVFCKALLVGRVQRLRLCDCATGDSVTCHIAAVLQHPACCLRYLDLSANGVKYLSDEFVNAVRGSTTLQGLNLSKNPLSRASVAKLCEAVALSETLDDLDLSCAGSLYSSKELSVAIAMSTSLKTLRLGHNTCWFESDAKLMACGLRAAVPHSACNLVSIDLSSSAISLEHCPHIADVIMTLPTLQHMCLRNNSICCKGVVELCRALCVTDTGLTTLNLSGNSITGVVVVSRLFSHCEGEGVDARRAPKSNERRGQYTDKGLLALASALESNRVLRVLDLSACNLGLGTNSFYDGADHGGVAVLCDAVKRNVSMRSVVMCNNNFKESTVRRLKRVAGGKSCFTADPANPTSLSPSPSSQLVVDLAYNRD